MTKLIDSIFNKDYVSASSLFEGKMNEIVENKLYESKRQVAADMDEALGVLKFSKAEIEKKKEQGYRRASEVLGDPSKKKMKPLVKLKKKKVSEEALDEAGLAPTKTGKFYRAGLKTGAAIGGAAGEVKRRLGVAKDIIQKYREGKAKEKAASASDDDAMKRAAGAEPSTPKSAQPTSSDKKEPGRLARNWAALRGKDVKKGGRAGKVGNVILKGVAGVLSNVEE